MGLLPSSCSSAPTGAECINAGVYYLDKARSRNGLPPYALPENFPSLSPTRQLFILINLDRLAYGLAPIPGMTAALNRDAFVNGVWPADDPHPSNTAGLNTWWPGWAGWFYNAPMAYETLVWNDGLGSTNPRCTPTDHSRCWGHRHSVLWRFPVGSVLAMGLAAGRDSHHRRGYAYLFVGGNPGSYRPIYTYRWKQAVADGAGRNTYDPGPAGGSLCDVPAVIGLSLAEASQTIEQRHCSVGDVASAHSNYEPGVVVEQHPDPARMIAPGSAVRLTVSLGPN
jgi:hypothetical protein